MESKQIEPITALIHILGETMSDGHGAIPKDWTSYSMILETYQGSFNSFHGYAYNKDSSITPVAANPLKVIPILHEYLTTLYAPGEVLPVALLIQYEKGSGQYTVTIEDTDPDRWKVTPKNFREIREELRPHFE